MFRVKQSVITVWMDEPKTFDVQMKKNKSENSWLKNAQTYYASKNISEDSKFIKQNNDENYKWVDVLEKSMSMRLFTIKENSNNLLKDAANANNSRN